MNILFDDQEFNDPTAGGGNGNYSPSAGDYAGDAAYYAKEGAAAAKKGAKKLIPIIILVVIALVVVGFVLSFLGSQQTITFSLEEKDGASLTGSRLIIKDSSGNQVLNKSGSSQTLTLGPGTYSIRATALSHKDFEDDITIPQVDDGGVRIDTFTASLKKDLKGEITIDLAETELYEKQVIVGEIRIDNTGEEGMADEKMLVATGTSATIINDINFSPALFDVSAGGAKIISFTITLNKDISAIEENQKIKFRIKGTDIVSNDKTLTLFPAVSEKSIKIDDDVDNKILKNYKLTSGKQTDVVIRITNNDTKIPLNNVKLTVEADSGFENKLSWFEFSNPDANPNEKTVSNISPNKGKEPVTLKITPSIDSKIGDKFKGTIKIESLSIQERTILIAVDLEVYKENTAKLEFKVTDLTTDCYTSGAACKIIPTLDKIILKNTGDVAVGPITYGFDEASGSNPNCETWIEFAVNTISKLEANEEKSLAFNLNLPDGETTLYTICYLKAAYLDPLTTQTNVDVSEPFQIKITVKESP